MAKQIRYGAYADFRPEKMVTAELACVTSGDPAVSDGMSLYICFSPGVVKRIATYADFEREIQNATQEIQDAFTEDVQAAIQAAIEATNNANVAVTQANEAAEQALSAAADAEEAAEAALAAAGGDISEKTVTFESQDAEDPEEWTDVDVLATGTKLSLLFQKVSSMFKNIRFLKKKTDELDLGVNELNTNLTWKSIEIHFLTSSTIWEEVSTDELSVLTNAKEAFLQNAGGDSTPVCGKDLGYVFFTNGIADEYNLSSKMRFTGKRIYFVNQRIGTSAAAPTFTKLFYR